MLEVVFFDIGGILELTPSLDWRPGWEQKLGLAPGELDVKMSALWRDGAIGTISEEEYEAGVQSVLGLTPTQLQEFLQVTWDEYLGTPNHELIAYFQALRSKCRTAIISNSFVGARERERERYGFEEMCELIVYSHEVGINKPDPEIYRRACDLMQVEPAKALLLDDLEENTIAAQAFGMKAVLYKNNAQAIAEIDGYF